VELETSQLKQPRILIVDDLAFMRSVIREILENNGFSVAGEAIDGRQGCEMYSAVEPDAVLMDITMPEMDGIESLRSIRKKDPSACIVMCSALGEQEYILKAITFGARDFIVKPFRPERVVSALRKALHIDA